MLNFGISKIPCIGTTVCRNTAVHVWETLLTLILYTRLLVFHHWKYMHLPILPSSCFLYTNSPLPQRSRPLSDMQPPHLGPSSPPPLL
jgi:hypothetical protein